MSNPFGEDEDDGSDEYKDRQYNPFKKNFLKNETKKKATLNAEEVTSAKSDDRIKAEKLAEFNRGSPSLSPLNSVSSLLQPNAKRRMPTILTTGEGDMTTATTKKKTLLGQ